MSVSKIQRMLAEILGVDADEIRPNNALWHGIDAVSLAKLIMRCERAFHITVLDEDVSDFTSVSDLARYVQQRAFDGRDDYAQPSDEAREAWYYE